MPQLSLSRLMGWFANCRRLWFKNWAIKTFSQHFGVDLSEAQIEDYQAFSNFNEFFTRKLKPGARPIDPKPNAIISPADGVVSELGQLNLEVILQAKGKYFSVGSLLNDEVAAQQFKNGSFLTTYLSPKDYHRFHMPCDGRLVEMRYIPGRLFSVNDGSVAAIDRLFARNERVVCMFESEFGSFAYVAVGAMIVGSIATAWHGVVNPGHNNKPQVWSYRDKEMHLKRGDECGYFQLGSTVILLFPKDSVTWESSLASHSELKMGQLIAEIK